MNPPLPSRISIPVLLACFAFAAALPALKGQDVMPRPVKQAPPAYPYALKALGIEGSVEIAFIIDSDGNVREPLVLRSNNPFFERPAIDAIVKWKFSPAKKDGKSVNMRTRQKISFTLNSGDGHETWQIKKAANHKELPEQLQWDMPPRVISFAFPVYPFEAIEAKEQTRFLLSMLVDPKGHVSQIKINGTPPESFAGAARAMASLWEFEPARKDGGMPCFALIGVEMDFRSNGEGTAPITDSARDILREISRPEPRIVNMRDLDVAPKEVTNRKVTYPVGLRAKGIEGSAVVEFYIDRDGDVQLPRLISASQEEFGHSAILAVACSRFEPPIKDKKTVIARMQRTVVFSLRD